MKLCRFTAASSGDVHIGLVTGGQPSLTDARRRASHDEPHRASGPGGRTRQTRPRRPAGTPARPRPATDSRRITGGVGGRRDLSAQQGSAHGGIRIQRQRVRPVYDAVRPEIFFKSLPDKVVAPGDAVGIRRDARWNVPEPELALVISSSARIVGFTIGNDMSSRDIEGENLLYLPQAKIYARSCAVGPWIVVGADEADVRQWSIQLEIERRGEVVFAGETSAGQIKRTFAELVEHCSDRSSFHTASCC